MVFSLWSLPSYSSEISIRYRSSRKKLTLVTSYSTSCITMERCWRFTSSASCATSQTSIHSTNKLWTSTISILEDFQSLSMASTTQSHHILMIHSTHRTTLARAHICLRTSKRFLRLVISQPFWDASAIVTTNSRHKVHLTTLTYTWRPNSTRMISTSQSSSWVQEKRFRRLSIKMTTASQTVAVSINYIKKRRFYRVIIS